MALSVPRGRGWFKPFIARRSSKAASLPSQASCSPEDREQRLARPCPFFSSSCPLPAHRRRLPLHFQVTLPSSPSGSSHRHQKRQTSPHRGPGSPSSEDKKPSLSQGGCFKARASGGGGTLLSKPLSGDQRAPELRAQGRLPRSSLGGSG